VVNISHHISPPQSDISNDDLCTIAPFKSEIQSKHEPPNAPEAKQAVQPGIKIYRLSFNTSAMYHRHLVFPACAQIMLERWQTHGIYMSIIEQSLAFNFPGGLRLISLSTFSST
jgi:hypothetical protein